VGNQEFFQLKGESRKEDSEWGKKNLFEGFEKVSFRFLRRVLRNKVATKRKKSDLNCKQKEG